MFKLLKRLRKLEGATPLPESHMALLHKIAYKAENRVLRHKKDKCLYSECYWAGRYMTVKEIVEDLEKVQPNG